MSLYVNVDDVVAVGQEYADGKITMDEVRARLAELASTDPVGASDAAADAVADEALDRVGRRGAK